ncbi:hypothetical protein KIH41_02225 [Litoribacter ruber]|uniref:hypothetical protein n=1 Tax=Litoribacter ruber TaxID=702568 RepID=UPI001BDB0371|nr:hypothetical protein [Litoribacter ruber]MBT0810096.1 hypothetical protein [Litoribacter ruber]
MMPLDLQELKAPAVITLLLFLISVMGSGILFTFIFYNQLFSHADTVKLLLIAFSIGSPIWLLNSYLFAHFKFVDFVAEGGANVLAIMGALVSIPVFYLPILLGFYFEIPGKWGIGSIIILEFLLFLGLLYDQIVLKKDERTKINS